MTVSPVAPSSSLRERRRRETARTIQLVTVRLGCAHGLDNVTIEMISAEAGISPRTFFNYYAYKEQAVWCDPPEFDPDSVAAFAEGTGSFMADLETLLVGHLSQLEPDRDLFAGIRTLAEQNPKLLVLKETSLLALRVKLTDILQRRLHAEETEIVQLCALMVLDTVRLAIERWSCGEAASVAASVREMLQRLRHGAALFREDIGS